MIGGTSEKVSGRSVAKTAWKENHSLSEPRGDRSYAHLPLVSPFFSKGAGYRLKEIVSGGKKKLYIGAFKCRRACGGAEG